MHYNFYWYCNHPPKKLSKPFQVERKQRLLYTKDTHPNFKPEENRIPKPKKRKAFGKRIEKEKENKRTRYEELVLRHLVHDSLNF